MTLFDDMLVLICDAVFTFSSNYFYGQNQIKSEVMYLSSDLKVQVQNQNDKSSCIKGQLSMGKKINQIGTIQVKSTIHQIHSLYS